jgi:beta-glucosidase
VPLQAIPRWRARLRVLVAIAIAGACGTAGAAAQTREAVVVDSVLALMTLPEKVGQLTQWTGIRAGAVGSFLGVHGAAHTREVQRVAVEESRLGIPLLFAHDVIHGFRTIFPVSLAEAASWNAAAVERSARIAAGEAAAHGLHWTFAPMVDIARDARWGRIVEGAGEDAWLGSVLAAARVRGFQGEDLAAPNTVLATAKHFVGYGAAEGGRDYNTVDISERTLLETYLPPFRAAIEAGAQSVMGAFNEIAGVPMHAHEGLIDGLLRRDWGFDGVLVSDYNAVQELMRHGIAGDSAEAAAAALRAGVDIDMVSDVYLRHLPAALRTGQVSGQDLDEAVRRVLRAKYRVGLFDDPYRYSDTTRQRTLTLAPEHIAFARELARESIVLLKNQDGVLPLGRDLGSVAVVGALADSAREMLGNWAAAGRAEDAVTILDGLRRALEPATRVVYARGTGVRAGDTTGFPAALAAARAADAVILVLGETESMSAEANNRARLDLPGAQLELAKRIVALGRPVVVVLMNGRPLSIPWLDEHVPAIVEAWYLGVQMGPAVADVLLGDYNPSGKLPVTFPRTVGQVPLHYDHKRTGRPPVDTLKYTSKYIDVAWTPLYPFGHGLSYTTFSYGKPDLDRTRMGTGDTVTVSVAVTNTGTRAGAEVVQLYLRDDVASSTRPVRQLRGFRKITLAPGETRTVHFRLGPDELGVYVPTGGEGELGFRKVVEPGSFTVFVGGSSLTTNQARFEVVP